MSVGRGPKGHTPGIAGFAGDASSGSGTGRFPRENRPLKEGGPWGKHGFPHGSDPEGSDAHDVTSRLARPAKRSRASRHSADSDGS